MTMDIIEKIDRDLKKYDIILVFLSGSRMAKDWIDRFVKSTALKNTSKKTLILSDMDICCEDRTAYEFHRMNKYERDSLEQLYTMYDFSDRFFVMSDHFQYGSLTNYVETGIITMEETFQTFFE